MVDFRYAQFCPLTRAVEILGERWTILILRELFLGPKRFRDLKAALNGVSSSVLADRLAKLEERGIVAHREMPAPSSALVYQLDEAGLALQPLLAELTRWGVRFLDAPGPGDSIRPEWLSLGLQTFARHESTESIRACLHVEGGAESVDLYLSGGKQGTSVSRTPLGRVAPVARVSAPPMEMLMFCAGSLEPAASGPGKALRVEGDADVARRIPSLFDFRPTPAPPPAKPDLPSIDQSAPGRNARRGKRPAAASGHQGAAGS